MNNTSRDFALQASSVFKNSGSQQSVERTHDYTDSSSHLYGTPHMSVVTIVTAIHEVGDEYPTRRLDHLRVRSSYANTMTARGGWILVLHEGEEVTAPYIRTMMENEEDASVFTLIVLPTRGPAFIAASRGGVDIKGCISAIRRARIRDESTIIYWDRNKKVANPEYGVHSV